MFAALVEHETILVQILRLPDYWHRLVCPDSSCRLASHVPTAALSRHRAPSNRSALGCSRNARQTRVAALIGFDVGGGEHVALAAVELVKFVGVLADVLTEFGNFLELFLPLRHTVGWLLLLQSFQNCLVFKRDSKQLFLAHFTIHAGLHKWISIDISTLVLLHDVRHFLKQNAVFSFNLGVSV